MSGINLNNVEDAVFTGNTFIGKNSDINVKNSKRLTFDDNNFYEDKTSLEIMVGMKKFKELNNEQLESFKKIIEEKTPPRYKKLNMIKWATLLGTTLTTESAKKICDYVELLIKTHFN
ncbi:hypothetical protein [Brochothrix thermosphacta]|uniref:hypothetical protein n=1 Tax=Brochothrix thermosphacta TaxID=2756 RepID=UPI0039B0CCE0